MAANGPGVAAAVLMRGGGSSTTLSCILPDHLIRKLTFWVRYGCAGRGGYVTTFHSTGVQNGRVDAYYLVLTRLNRIFENDARFNTVDEASPHPFQQLLFKLSPLP